MHCPTEIADDNVLHEELSNQSSRELVDLVDATICLTRRISKRKRSIYLMHRSARYFPFHE